MQFKVWLRSNAAINFGIFILLISKFYYLWGVGEKMAPLAPTYLVLLRDVFFWSFILYFGYQVRSYFRELKWFWLFLLFGLLISFTHLYFAKSISVWAQHYIRNVLGPMLFYPVIYGLFRQGKLIAVKNILVLLFVVNLLVSYFPLLTGPLSRPTGLFGDAIINSTILMWGLVAVYLVGVWQGLLATVVMIPLIYLMSSVSALVCIFGGIFVVIFSNLTSSKQYLLKYKYWIVAIFLLSGVVYKTVEFQKNKMGDNEINGLPVKIELLIRAMTCKTDDCYRTWSFTGRIASNVRPIVFCNEKPTHCFVGKIDQDFYERLESTFGSLVINWGILFFLGFVIWFVSNLRLFFKYRHSFYSSRGEHFLWAVIFISGIIFCVLNTFTYRYPVNILVYASMAYYRFLHFKERQG